MRSPASPFSGRTTCPDNRAWLRYPQILLRLQAQPPARVRQTISDRQLRVPLALWSIHRLQQEVAKIQIRIALRLCTRLRKDQLQLVAAAENQVGARFGADANPVDARRRHTGAVGLNRDLETLRVQRV